MKKHWQIEENEKSESTFDHHSLEAGGYPAEKVQFASSHVDKDEDDDDDDDDDRIHKEDWGDVDPQPDTGRDPMDPSGPGSAV